MLTLVVTIVVSGAAGGLANYLLLPPPDNEVRDWLGLLRFIIVGIVVAFTVPLFLSLAQSSLTQKILSQADPAGPISEILIFAGFCIVASFASRAFMDTLSKRVLAAIGETRAIAKEAGEKADRTEESIGLVEEAIDRASGAAQPEPDVADSTTALADDTVPNISLSETERKVLRAVSRLTLRTSTGIAKDSGLPRNQIGEVLDELNRKGLTELTTSPNTGGVRHRITRLGALVLNRSHRDDRTAPNS